MEREELVNLITREVLDVLDRDCSKFAAERNLLPDALVAGKAEDLPPQVRKRYNFYSAVEISGTEALKGFERLFVTELTLTELSDIANGRDDGKVQKAVLGFLLLGKEVTVLNGALPHRKYALTANRSLYSQYEEYVRKLKNMHVSFMTGGPSRTVYLACAKPDPDLPEGVITEAVARMMAADEEGDVIKIPRKSVVTPSAMDVFGMAGKKLVKE